MNVEGFALWVINRTLDKSQDFMTSQNNEIAYEILKCLKNLENLRKNFIIIFIKKIYQNFLSIFFFRSAMWKIFKNSSPKLPKRKIQRVFLTVLLQLSWVQFWSLLIKNEFYKLIMRPIVR